MVALAIEPSQLSAMLSSSGSSSPGKGEGKVGAKQNPLRTSPRQLLPRACGRAGPRRRCSHRRARRCHLEGDAGNRTMTSQVTRYGLRTMRIEQEAGR